MAAPGYGTGQSPEVGLHVTAYRILDHFVRNLDVILMGRVWGAEATGFYSRALNTALNPISCVNSPLSTVIVPVLSRPPGRPPATRQGLSAHPTRHDGADVPAGVLPVRPGRGGHGRRVWKPVVPSRSDPADHVHRVPVRGGAAVAGMGYSSRPAPPTGISSGGSCRYRSSAWPMCFGIHWGGVGTATGFCDLSDAALTCRGCGGPCGLPDTAGGTSRGTSAPHCWPPCSRAAGCGAAAHGRNRRAPGPDGACSSAWSR